MRIFRFAAYGAALASLAAAALPARLSASAQSAAPQLPAPPFRSGVDLIPVDVQVVDATGRPVRDLDLGSFEVTIDGRRRRVVSVQLIDARQTAARAPAGPATSRGGAREPGAAEPAPVEATPRVFILAVDASSFDQSIAQPVIKTAARFIGQLRPDDEIGLFTFPFGPKVDPTTDHDAVVRALGDIITRRERPWTDTFTLLPADVVELSMWLADLPTSGLTEQLLEALCPDEESDCRLRLTSAVRSAMLSYEAEVQTTIGTLLALMTELGNVPNRKTLVLVSGGLLTADRPGARPDGMGLGLQAGRTAAEANVSVYTLFVDHGAEQQMAAESRSGRNLMANPARDREIYGRWLDEFSGRAGGVMIPVRSDDGSAAFDRILLETSAYYLLGVEPGARDRDGRAHELHVKVRGRDVSVRGRSWVRVPREGEAAPAYTRRQPAVPVAAAATPPRGRPVTPALRAIADAFDRDDRRAIAAALGGPNGLPLVQTLRASESPWPDSPDRMAAFALDVALAGLRTGVQLTIEESLRLLAEYTIRVRRPALNDPFECAWLRTQTAGLLGLQSPTVANGFLQQAVNRCPDDPRLRLGAAVGLDQLLEQGAVVPAPGAPVTEAEQGVLDAFAALTGAAVPEARVRAAFVHHRAGRFDEGLAALEGLVLPVEDEQLAYLFAMVRGQLLRGAGRLDEAAEAYRTALQTWPDAQTPRIALVTLQVQRGETEDAATLAGQVLTSAPEASDPWWLFRLGDYRAYAGIRAVLRGLLP